jgi:hypothetical protein
LYLSHAWYKSHPAYPSWPDHPNNIWWRVLSRVRRLYETGFGLSTGFIGSQYGTLNHNVYTLQLTTTESLTESFQAGNHSYGIPCHQ